MRHGAVALAALSGLAASAGAGIITSSGVVAYSLQPAPGTAGAFFTPTNSFSTAGIDGNGRVWVGATLIGGDASTSNPYNARGWWSGTSTADLTKVVRDAEQPSGMPAGVTIGTNATTTGLGSTAVRISSGNSAMYGVNFIGAGITANVNDSALYVGDHLGQSYIARRGDAAPGTTGAVYNNAWRSYNGQTTAYNGNGRVAFNTALSGGDTVTANNAGIFTGPAGSIQMVARKGDALDAGMNIASLGNNTKLNANNQVMYDIKLGGAGVTTANDSAYYIHTPGSGNTRVYREGDAADGTAGAVFTSDPGVGFKAFSNAGVLFAPSLTGGDTTTANNQGLYVADQTGPHLVVRKGAAAPGTDALFGGFNGSNLAITNSGYLTVQASLTGGTSTTASDSGIWSGYGGSLTLALREGDAALDTAGAVLSNLSGISFASNNNGQFVITANLLGGDVVPGTNDRILYGYTPGVGLTTICRMGDSFEVTPGTFKTISQMTVQGVDNGSGASQSLNDLGVIALQLTFTDNSNAIVRTFVPAPGVASLGALGLIVGGLRRRRA